MKVTQKILVTTVTLAIMLGSASAMAYGKKAKHNEHGRCGIEHGRGLISQLDLSAEQQNQLQVLRQQQQQARKDQWQQGSRDEMRALREQEQKLVLADHFDHAAARELVTRTVDKQAANRLDRMEKRQQMMSILTNEQKAKLQGLQQACMQKQRQHNKPRRHQQTTEVKNQA